MARVGHGETSVLTITRARMAGPASLLDTSSIPAHTRFDYMFPTLQADPNNFPPETKATLDALKLLGEAMTDEPETSPVGGATDKGDSAIPAAYTYLGQFIDHDITFDTGSATIADLSSDSLKPLTSLAALQNTRTCRLDLDSVYDGPRDGDKMLVGPVTALNGTAKPRLRVPNRSDLNDLPRKPRSTDSREDRAARIGDPRNDENLIVAQLHTAFLKAHNALIDQGKTFDQAKRALRQRYQHMVLHDFLEARMCDPAVIADVLQNGPRFWRLQNATELFMPAEFAAAAYRFGHTMIRSLYDFNLNFEPATLGLLFTFTALSGELGQDLGLPAEQTETLGENWMIEWDRFVSVGGSTPQMARKIDTRLSEFTFDLRNTFGRSQGDEETDPAVKKVAPMLGKRNLLRSYLFRVPTGQAVARLLGEPALQGQALIDALPTQALKSAAQPFATATPLWFYVLAEAGDRGGANGEHLGRVGSRILGEAFWNLIRFSNDSVLNPEATFDFQSFTLADLIALASTQDGGMNAAAAAKPEKEPA